jgi:spore coat protein SA
VQIYLYALCKMLQQEPTIRLTLLCPGGHHAQLTGVQVVPVKGGVATYRKRVVAHLKRLHPDVVQIDNRPDWIPGMRRVLPDAKIILNLHSITFLGPQHIHPNLVRSLLRMTNVVIVNSYYLQRSVRQRFALRKTEWNPLVIHPGVELSRFQPNRQHPGRHPNHPFQVIFVGRVIRQKGVHVLVSAIRQLHLQGMTARLTIVGKTPPWESRYGQAIRKSIRGLPIRWVGFVPPMQLPRLLWRSHVLVCPSQEREAFGLVNVEAMASGLPVIASRQGGIPEIVNNQCGILVSRYTEPQAFAKAIRHMMVRQGLWEQLQQGATKRANDFTWEKAARQFVRVYESTQSGK